MLHQLQQKSEAHYKLQQLQMNVSQLFPAVESIVLSLGTTAKTQLITELNKLFNEDFDPEILEVVFDGLAEKYDSEFYGIEFSNRPKSVAFYPKPLNTLKVI